MANRPSMRRRRRKNIATAITVLLIIILCVGIIIAAFIISLKHNLHSGEKPVENQEPVSADSQNAPSDTLAADSETEETSNVEDPIGEQTTDEDVTSGEPSDDPTPVSPINGGPEYNDATTLGTGTAPAGYMDELFFYGDSTTYGLRAYKIFGSKQTPRVWTPASGTLALFNATNELIYDSVDDVELTLSEIAAKYHPKYLIVTLGVNGISMMDETYFKSEYKKVIDIIHSGSPDTIIMLQSMYPQSAMYPATEKFNNQAIIRGNGWIHDIAAECGLKFINSYNYFLDDAGYMDSKYDNGGDGMHFNDLGYQKMLEYVSAHPYHD